MARRRPTVAIELPPAPRRAEAPPEDPPPPPPPQALVDLGEPPTDQLGLFAYTLRAVAATMREIMLDPTLNPAERRREIRQSAATIKGLRSDAEIWEALRELRRDRDEIDRPARGAPVEATPAAVADPGAARPKRARPPKRAG